MKVPILATSVWLLAAALTQAQCGYSCRNYWSAPSPTLCDACHHTTGVPFTSCDCPRAYTSPHVLGYGGTGCCWGFQESSCLSCGRGPRCWAPAYGNGATGLPSNLAEYSHSQGDIGYESYAKGYAVEYSDWERLGQIPSDLALAGGIVGGRIDSPAASAAPSLPSLKSAIPGLGL